MSGTPSESPVFAAICSACDLLKASRSLTGLHSSDDGPNTPKYESAKAITATTTAMIVNLHRRGSFIAGNSNGLSILRSSRARRLLTLTQQSEPVHVTETSVTASDRPFEGRRH